MDELILEFKETGPCKVDVEKVIKAWDDRFSVFQYKNEYRLIEQIEVLKEPAYKVTITKEQALEIIERLALLPIVFFLTGATYRSHSNIISEIQRTKKMIMEHEASLNICKDMLIRYEQSLKHAKR